MNPGAFRPSQAPFGSSADGGQAYLGGAQKRVLSTLSESLSKPGTLTLLIAPPGYGKSTLIEILLRDLGEFKFWSTVSGSHTDPGEFLRAVILGFGFEECLGSVQQLRPVLEAFLAHQWHRGDVPALVVDDAQELAPEVFKELRWLAALKGDDEASLSIMLSGLPGLDHVVHKHALESAVSGRVQTIELKALSEADTGAYIRHRLANAEIAGARGLFDESAVSLIYRYTGGVPALINVLCQSAMNCSTAVGKHVTHETVLSALSHLHQLPHSGPGSNAAKGGQRDVADRDAGRGRLVATGSDGIVIDYRIVKERVLIGRRPDNDLQLNSPGASRYHALMLLDPGGWLLIDLHSRNGTNVNSRGGQQHRLADGDTIQIAGWTIQCFLDPLPGSHQQGVD
jgi:type II secretory pathway predicted ATPase ExeA